MAFPLALLTALLISMAIIPLMMRLAPRLGMVDKPDPRKVHQHPIPRVGGIGITLGTLVSLLIWMPQIHWLGWFMAGCLVLFAFGAWDDSHEIGHYTKFIGQFVAAGAIVYGGDLWVRHLPFLDVPVDPLWGRLFTVVALVGMINAINHSDGLDGLAGGESLMSLGCLAYLGYLADSPEFLLVVSAVAGGLFGFLRFNSHPARVFMGDAGSQFLGYALGVLTVSLTQDVHSGLSMALPALILGLPIVDIIAVFAQRIYGGMNWFRATRNHVHHRLLDLGFAHPQAVLIIYAIQAFLIICAILMRYESDAVVAGTYAVVCAAVFAGLWGAKRRGWRVPQSITDSTPGATRLQPAGHAGNVWRRMLFSFVWMALPLYFLLGGLMARNVSGDIGMAGAIAAGVSMLGLLLSLPRGGSSILLRLGVFSAAALVVYTLERQGGTFDWVMHPVLFALAIASAMTIRMSGGDEFRTTPLDYLMILLVVSTGVLAQQHFKGFDIGMVIIQLVVLFYSYEVIASRQRSKGLGVKLTGVGACCAGVLLAGRALL